MGTLGLILGLMFTCSFNGCGPCDCIINSRSLIGVSVFLSVVFTFQHGISESNKDLKFKYIDGGVNLKVRGLTGT